MLAALTALITDAWDSFERPRPEEPAIDANVLERLAAPLPDVPADPSQVLADAARILDESVSPARPLYLAYIGSTGLEVGVLAEALAATYDVNLAVTARRRRPPRAAGGPLGRRVRRLSVRRGRFHERRDDLEPHRDPGRPRAGAAGVSNRGLRRSAGGRVLLGRGPPLGRPRGRGRGHRLGFRPLARPGLRAPHAPRGPRRAPLPRTATRGSRRSRSSPTAARPSPAPSTRSMSSPTSVGRTAPGCTSTVPTASRRRPRSRRGRCSPGWSGPTQPLSTRTSGSACRRAAV